MRSFIALIAALVLAFPASSGAAEISGYRTLFTPVTFADGSIRIAIRAFRQDGVPHYLAVDPANLATAVIPESAARPLAGGTARLRQTPYLRGLADLRSSPRRLQNDGVVHGKTTVDGLFLTADLCPSSRPFEREAFEAVERSGIQPVPVAVAISGEWLVRHRPDFEWLTGEVRAGRLAITWVNHSLSHPYRPAEPLERNFLLTPGTDFRKEVTATEILLLERGVVPSVFFRFPGLVSDRRAVEELLDLGVIPLGADAWLAKGEKPVEGSIILVHGNGNEPKGIKLLLALFQGRRSKIRLLPLADAVLAGGQGGEIRREGAGNGLGKGPVPNR